MSVGNNSAPVFNVRRPGDQCWYSPHRDLVYLFPDIVRNVIVQLDDTKSLYRFWLANSDASNKNVEETVKALANLMILSGDAEKSFEDIWDESGFGTVDEEAMGFILACIGYETLITFHDRLMGVDTPSKKIAIGPETMRKTATKFKMRMSPVLRLIRMFSICMSKTNNGMEKANKEDPDESKR